MYQSSVRQISLDQHGQPVVVLPYYLLDTNLETYTWSSIVQKPILMFIKVYKLTFQDQMRFSFFFISSTLLDITRIR